MPEQPQRPSVRPPLPPGTRHPAKEQSPIPTWVIVPLGIMVGAVAVLFGTQGLRHYGFGVFVILPLIIGWSVAGIYSYNRDWNWLQGIGVVLCVFIGIAISLMLHLAEGMFCILLAGFLAAPFIMLGVCIAKVLKARRLERQRKGVATRLHCLVVCLIPASLVLESTIATKPPILEQTTRIVINASPEVVWRFIPAFPKIDAPPTKMLAMGLAHPISAEMDGVGVGARRRCVLSTGVMAELITVWEPTRRLEFDVLETPAAMAETNPFGKVKAAHTEGYFICKHGRFVLTALPGGRTMVEGTSWFEHDLWPQFYWAPLTQEVVREVHERVLTHIKGLAEHAAM